MAMNCSSHVLFAFEQSVIVEIGLFLGNSTIKHEGRGVIPPHPFFGKRCGSIHEIYVVPIIDISIVAFYQLWIRILSIVFFHFSEDYLSPRQYDQFLHPPTCLRGEGVERKQKSPSQYHVYIS